MKIGILSNFTENEGTNQMFLREFRDLKHNPSIIYLQETYLHDGIFIFKNKDIASFDYILFASIAADVKKAVTISQYLKDNNVRYFDNNLLEVRYAINKIYDSYKIKAAKLPFPKTYQNPYDSKIEYPIIIKRINSTQGKGVFLIKNQNEMHKFFSKEESKKYIIQEYIKYDHDLRIFKIGDNKLFAMERIPKNGEFRANYHMGATVAKFDINEDIKTLSLKAGKATKSIIAGVDILVSKDKYYILEVNRSPGLGGISKATGVNIAKEIVNYCLGI